METTERLEALVRRLQMIAEKNGDEFDCGIVISGGRSNRIVKYRFYCQETEDEHAFVGTKFCFTIDECCHAAESQITTALIEWGYEE